MKKDSKQFKKLWKGFRANPNLETGFSMLEAVVVVGVLLALAVGGFFAFGPITENAKTAKVKSAASEVHTGVLVASMDGDPATLPENVITDWNDSTDKIKVAITSQTDSDYCITATDADEASIAAQSGDCSGSGGSGAPSDGSETPNPPIQRTTEPIMVSNWSIGNTSGSLKYATDNCQNNTISLPLVGAVNVNIDWGDGTVQTVTTNNPYHQYATDGAKTITIEGTFEKWVGEDWGTWSSDCLTEVTKWGETGTTSIEGGFYGAENMTAMAEFPSSATSLRSAFSMIEFNGDVSRWDLSNVTNTSWMFYDNPVFDRDISGWNVSNATDMSNMFYEATAFNQDIRGWNTSSATMMDGMFYLADSFNYDLSGWNVDNVSDNPYFSNRLPAEYWPMFKTV